MTSIAGAGESAKRARRGACSAERLAKRLGKLAFEAVECLEEIMTDPDVKPADRISAAKLTFEVFNKQGGDPDPGDKSLVRVVFEDMPHGFAE